VPLDEDISIVMALRAGEPQAARALWLRFEPLVSQVLRRLVGPGPHVEDLAQDVFMTMFRRVHRLRDPTAVRSFIVSIAKFTARQERRKLWISRQPVGDGLHEPASEPVSTPDVDAREGLLRLAEILAGLRTRERSAFVLRFIEGKGISETASELGVSVATVKRRLTRARSRIVMVARRDPALAPYLAAASA